MAGSGLGLEKPLVGAEWAISRLYTDPTISHSSSCLKIRAKLVCKGRIKVRE